MIDDAFLDEIPDDPMLRAKAICDKYFELRETVHRSGKATSLFFDDYLELLGLFMAFAEAHNLEFTSLPVPGPDRGRTIVDIGNFFTNLRTLLEKSISQSTLNNIKAKYLLKFGSTFYYEFSDGDLKKMQGLINELRTLIAQNKDFEEDHKIRLLKRLEKLQSELHKRVSDLDRFWGLVGEAGVALGKFGTDAKPIVDRIRELVDIVWRTQSIAEELPSDSPRALLPPPKDKDDTTLT
jgi:hypothetical protein